MAQTSAPTDPSTLEAAFSDQAHRTAALFRSSSRASPVGKGMAIRKPPGEIIRTVDSTLTGNGIPAPPVNTPPISSATIATTTAIVASAAFKRLSSPARNFRLKKLPTPLDNSSVKMTQDREIGRAHV